jgi:elongation factor P
MITPNDFREGLIFKDGDRKLQVITYQHHRKSQSRAKVLTKMRDVDTGAVVEKNIPSDTQFEEVDVRRQDCQYLYADEASYHFMDNATYEQHRLPKDRLGGEAKFLVENMDVMGVYFDGAFRTIELPPNIQAVIEFAEPGVKGDTVSNLMKNARTDTGIEVKVPLFIKAGDKIKIDTRTGGYVERVKE